MNIDSVVEKLAGDRRVLEPRNDLRDSFAEVLRVHFGASINHLGYSNVDLMPDILATVPRDGSIAINLMYKTRSAVIADAGREFHLKGQGAADQAQYDLWRRVSMLERLTSDPKRNISEAYSIMITNDPYYWTQGEAFEGIFYSGRLTNGRTVSGRLAWADRAREGSKRKREEPIELSGTYAVEWKHYASVQHVEFRYLALAITERQPAKAIPRFGAPYRAPTEDPSLTGIEMFSVDPAVVERGKRGHVETQRKIEQQLRSGGITPLSPGPEEPAFDIAWLHGSTIYVAEIKSLTTKNEEIQLRLGLGQVLRYVAQLRRKHDYVVPVLIPERGPTDHTWVAVCSEAGVALFSPDNFSLTALNDLPLAAMRHGASRCEAVGKPGSGMHALKASQR